MNGITKIKNKLITSDLKDSDYRVLTYLIARSKNGECFPSLKTIAKELSRTKETIRKSIERLIEQKYITKQSRKIGSGKITSNLYKINEEYLVNKPKRDEQPNNVELFDYNWLDEED